jgi:uncharacterized protein YjbJ (UPF0337 family)
MVITVPSPRRNDVAPYQVVSEPPHEGWLIHSIRGWEMIDKKDMATEGTEDRLKGAAKQAEGRVRNALGGLTGNTGEQVKGKGQEIKGKVQDAAGKAKQRLDPEPGVDEE